MVSTNSIFVFRSNFERSTARFNLFTKTLYISSGHCSLSLFLIVTVAGDIPSVSFTQRYFSISFFNSGDILILAIYYFLPLFYSICSFSCPRRTCDYNNSTLIHLYFTSTTSDSSLSSYYHTQELLYIFHVKTPHTIIDVRGFIYKLINVHFSHQFFK